MRKNIALIAVLIVALIIALGYFLIGGDGLGDSVAPAQQSYVDAAKNRPPQAVNEQQGSATFWLAVSVVLLSAATIVSVGISFYLYRWRRILLNQPHLIVPEEWGKYLDGVGTALNMLTATVHKNLGLVGQETGRNSDYVSKLTETFLTLQKAIDDRDEEIKRLRKGYDAEIYRRFLKRFIRVDQLADDYLHTSDDNEENLAQVKRLLEDALDECGIEAFVPSIGDDSRKANGIADNPKTTATDNEEADFKIVEVLEKGYRLRGNEREDVLIPAKVRIAVFKT